MSLDVFAEIILKVTAILVAAYVVNHLSRKFSAATIHLVWMLAVVVVLAVPFVSATVPVVHVRAVLPSAIESPAALASIPGAVQSASPVPWRTIAFSVWITGALIVLARLLFGVLNMYSLTRRASPAPFEAPANLRIRVSNRIGVPLTWGFRHAVILMPGSALDWPTTRVNTAIAHERAHIDRLDWSTQMLGAIACAAYWFHPLMWVAASRMAIAAEKACDDRVLASGVKAPDYASELLEIAKTVRRLPGASLCMAAPHALEIRIRAILESGRPRNRPTWIFVAASLTAFLALLLPVSTRSLSAQTSTGSLSGTVRDPSGAVIPSALVGAKNLDGNNQEATRTDAGGHFQLSRLPFGRYALTIQMSGFKPFHSDPIQVSGTAPSIEATLDVGGVFESVEVLGHGPTAREQASSPQRIRVGGSVQATRLVSKVQPVYRDEAQRAGLQGTVLMTAVIGIDGTPMSLTVISKSTDPKLVDAATEAVRQWRYEPTLLNSAPVEVVTTIAVTFRLAP
jgi:TonB family protein